MILTDEQYKLIELIHNKIKSNLYNNLYIPNPEYEYFIDEAIVRILKSIFFGGQQSKVILIGKDGRKVEFFVDPGYNNRQSAKPEDVYDTLKKDNYVAMVISHNMLDENKNLKVIIFTITKLWTLAIIIPLKKVIRPREGDAFSFTPEMVEQIEFVSGKSSALQHPLNFYYLLEGPDLVIA